MKFKIVSFIICILECLICRSQSLQIVPKAGFNYHGISYIEKGDYHPDDFQSSVPKLVACIGVDVKFASKKFTHVVSLQSTALGPAFSFSNVYTDKGIVPSVAGHHMASSSDQALLSYGLEKGSKGNSWVRGNYCLQVGIGFNKSKTVFDSTYLPDSYGMEVGRSYKEYFISYKRSGMGAFLSLKGGVSLYNKKNRPVLNVQCFWHQGLLKMAEFDLHYRYGYYDHPEYQKEERVKFNSRGTVFGVVLSVPIHLLKK